MIVLTLVGKHENDWQDAPLNVYLTVNGRVMQAEKVERVLESYC